MNQDQLRDLLLELCGPHRDFRVVFSGKTSRKVDGLYKSESREIILHNRNAETDERLIYTAIHELAHHIQFSEPPVPLTTRTHNTRFWSIFHSLLNRAEALGLYSSSFDRQQEFIDLTRRIRHSFLAENGRLMKELGRLLQEARALCDKYHASYEDYLDRVLRLPRSGARAIEMSHVLNLDPRIGFENMRTVSRIPEEEKRGRAQTALLEGSSPEMVKMRFLAPETPADPLEAMHRERTRLQKMVLSLEKRIRELDRRISEHGERT